MAFLFLFDLLSVLLITVDIVLYEKQITPLTIFGGVYVILITFNNTVAHKLYSFYQVTPRVLILIFSFFLLIFFTDLVGGFFYRKSKHSDMTLSTNFTGYTEILILFLIGAFAYLLQFIRLVITYGLNIKGMNNGILGHLTSLAFILGPVSMDLALKTRKKVNIILVSFINIAVLCISIIFGGKYVIFINSAYFVLYFALKRNKKIRPLTLLKFGLPLVLGAFVVFAILYYAVPNILGLYPSTMSFAVQHLFYYLLGSLSANNYAFSHIGEGYSSYPFAVIINIFKLVTQKKDYIVPIYSYLFQVNETTVTNVAGLLGETVFDLGLFKSYLYVGAVFAIINFFYYQYRCHNRFCLSFGYSSAIAAFLFFGNFFSVSGVLLPLLLAFALDIASLLPKGKYHL